MTLLHKEGHLLDRLDPVLYDVRGILAHIASTSRVTPNAFSASANIQIADMGVIFASLSFTRANLPGQIPTRQTPAAFMFSHSFADCLYFAFSSLRNAFAVRLKKAILVKGT
jgi:hypothetical protein